MSALPPDASSEDIESELMFTELLLQSLDGEDEDYAAKKLELQALQEVYERMRDAINDPDGHHPHTPGSTHTTSNLMARESNGEFKLAAKPSLGATLPPAPALSDGVSYYHDGRLVNNGSLPPGYYTNSPYSTAAKKRRREGSDVQPHQGFQSSHKSRRTSDSPGTSTASTPPSVESLEQEEKAFTQRYGLNLSGSAGRNALRKKWEEEQRQHELRYKMLKEDEAVARQLQSQAMPPLPSRYTTQSYLSSSGKVERPLRPSGYLVPPPSTPNVFPSKSVQTEPRTFSSTSADYNAAFDGQQSRHVTKSEIVETHPGLSSWPPHPVPMVQRKSVIDEDDDLQEITPAEFAAFAQTDKSPYSATLSPETLLSNSHAPGGSYNSAHNPYNAWPNGQMISYGVRGMGGNPVYNTPTAVASSHAPNIYPLYMQNQVGGLPVTTPSWVTSAMSGMSHITSGVTDLLGQVQSLVGGSWPTSGTDLNNILDLDEYPDNIGTYPKYGDLHAHGLDYLLNDPTRTKEDIEALLSNIRPDEELPPEMRLDTPDAMKRPLMEHQKLGLTWLKAQEEGSNKGAILADDMGLGKTIQALALIVSRPSDDPGNKTNLFIAPVSLLRQWEQEIKSKINERTRLRTYVYHGQRVGKVSFAALSSYDIVLTTFGTIAAEYKRKQTWLEKLRENEAARPDPKGYALLGDRSKWYRIIVDEAQNIKNKSTRSAQAAHHLNSTYRLCMTGTPMMNGIHELFSLIKFLRIPPYNSLERFNRDFVNPLKGRGEVSKERAMIALQVLLKAILLRRTKQSQIDGRPILNLPERTTEVKHAIFSPDEVAFYKHLENKTQLQVNKYLKAGTIGKNYSNILVLLLRLRQACCHPNLIKDHGMAEDGNVTAEEMEALAGKLSQNVIAMIKAAEGAFECPVCYDAVENPTIFFPCGHRMCSECFARMTDPAQAMANGEAEGTLAKCPECRSKLDPQKIIKYISFKKVHLPEQYRDDNIDLLLGKGETDSETDSETDGDEDPEDDANSQGDLRDFVVDDDAKIEEDNDDVKDVIKDEMNDELNGVIKDEIKDEHVSANEEFGDQKRERSRFKKRRHGTAKAKKPSKPLAVLKKEGMRNAAAKRRYLRRLRRDWVTSGKIEKTVEILRAIQSNDITEKTIIFSQFTSLLDLLEVPIDEQGWGFRRYDGSMSSKLRNDAVNDFMEKPQVKIMLVSLKAGNAGLNLTAASQVIILDPFWNPYIEEQAIDRAHRIGQSRPVMVHRVLVENTVEDRILALQEKKRALISQALDEKAGQSLSRLGPAELRYLFGISSTL